MAMKVRLGQAVTVTNKNRKKFSNADTEYVAVMVNINGKKKTLLLTHTEVRIALDRASKNPEDLLKQSLLSKILD